MRADQAQEMFESVAAHENITRRAVECLLPSLIGHPRTQPSQRPFGPSSANYIPSSRTGDHVEFEATAFRSERRGPPCDDSRHPVSSMKQAQLAETATPGA